MAVKIGMGPAVITNGWLLPTQLDELAAAGLKTVYISIDALRWPTTKPTVAPLYDVHVVTRVVEYHPRPTS